ncbi:hypothetical protein ACIQVL_38430 [Streptomyces sp. NPDC090499]|uniref:hypothetical protein n=1 Tax=Streptomyces sp. NPDC090499 TaxID=3365965 RepID=UPI00380EB411
MRSTSLPKLALAAALGCTLLSACGTQHSTTGQPPAARAVPAATPLDASPGVNDPETRFLALLTRIAQSCAPDDKGMGDVPDPRDLPGWEDAPPPRYGAGETPPGAPDATGDIPVPVDAPASPTK